MEYLILQLERTLKELEEVKRLAKLYNDKELYFKVIDTIYFYNQKIEEIKELETRKF